MAPPREVTKEEVKLHNRAADCWIIIDKKVYDVTAFIGRHPGEGISGQYVSFLKKKREKKEKEIYFFYYLESLALIIID